MTDDGSYTAGVRRQVERLRHMKPHLLEARVAAKRVGWLRARGGGGWPATPRGAYDLFIRDYLGLRQEVAPIVSESETEIVWLSKNRCPTLDACQELGLDTRRVCRAVYEKPVQALLSLLDPQLRFLRSYEEIRPHAPYCRESVVKLDFSALMRLAIEEARRSRAEGNKGYGAVVVQGQRLVSRAHDTASSNRDPSQHAELNAIRQAVATLGTPDLAGCVLVSTCEPCPMCSSLAVWANLTSVVYGASIRETAAAGKVRILVEATTIAENAPSSLEVVGGVLAAECLELYA